ncbi:uncharacterized protein LOC111635252 [Centruroides sculpturatus]|uniref:uncharacterized protein LOC111635252 n=1 Tax=Centruroides sculpturatus TaxID=218467 RepID=UPI000C6D8B0B|nr:uncharacterized protein LOC111635252 [Centruroides sculpturatus]
MSLKAQANRILWRLTHLIIPAGKQKELLAYLDIGSLPNLEMDHLFHHSLNTTFQTTYSPLHHPAHLPEVSMGSQTEGSLPYNIVYMDGSKSKTGVGAGLVHYNTRNNQFMHKESHRLAGFCSITQAELYAIYRALKYINTSTKLKGKNIYICSDSRTALQSISSGKLGGNIQRMIIQELTGSTSHINFMWTRAHSGDTGNEEADRLAREVSSSTTDIAFEDIPLVATKKLIWNTMINIWQRNWEEDETGRTTFSFFPDIAQRLQLQHLSINFKLLNCSPTTKISWPT